MNLINTLRTHVRERMVWLYVNRQRGYTLLEYCAGAAIITGILWVALNGMGNNLATLLQRVGLWATARSTAIQVD